jgi:CrcB protein
MKTLMPILYVGTGGFIGSVLRYLLSLAGQRYSISFPHGTLWANVLGCFTIGVVTALATETELLSPSARLFLATGICGGFTTMSTFNYEMFQLVQESEYLYASGYLFMTLAGCAIMFWLGTLGARLILKA